MAGCCGSAVNPGDDMFAPFVLALIFISATTVSWSSAEIIFLLEALLYCFFLFWYLGHLATRWSRALSGSEGPWPGTGRIPISLKAMPLVREALAREGWGPTGDHCT